MHSRDKTDANRSQISAAAFESQLFQFIRLVYLHSILFAHGRSCDCVTAGANELSGATRDAHLRKNASIRAEFVLLIFTPGTRRALLAYRAHVLTPTREFFMSTLKIFSDTKRVKRTTCFKFYLQKSFLRFCNQYFEHE
jgi:hypothetical protein